MSRRSFGFALASLIVMSGSAFADDFFRFDNPGGVIWSNSAQSVYVNPYTATDLTKNQTVTVYCDDWNSDFSGNPYWYANVNSLTSGNTSKFKYGKTTPEYKVTLDANNKLRVTTGDLTLPADAFDRYREVAWLDDQWRTHAVGFDQVIVAAAVWTLFVDGSHVGSPEIEPTSGLIGAINKAGYAAEVFSYLTQAENAVQGGWDASGWSVITPDEDYFKNAGGPAGSGLYQTIDGDDMQEFVVYSTPEPGAVILLGTVLGILGLTRFCRKLRA